MKVFSSANTSKSTTRRPFLDRRYFLFLAFVGLISLLISFFVLRVGFVNGISMEPTLEDRQPILIWQVNYQPVTGDIVVTDKQNILNANLTKRVIACEGQHLAIQDGTIWIDGSQLQESYLYEQEWFAENTEMIIPEGFCYLMGDNRNNSLDSRDIGPVSNSEIMGKVIWP